MSQQANNNTPNVSASEPPSAEAFTKLIAQHIQLAFQIACFTLSNTEDARDAMQETFIKAWLNRDKYNPKYPFSGWINRILINTCYDKLRKEKHHQKWLDDVAIGEQPASTTNYEQKDHLRAIRQLSRQLPTKQRMAFILRDIFDLSMNETAELLQVSNSSLKANLCHARKSMSILLKKLENKEEN